MTIQGHSARITPLDAEGQPVGPAQDVGAAMLTLAQEEVDPDAESPCFTPSPLRWVTIEITALDLRMAHLLFGSAYQLFVSRWIFGRPRPLAVNGREYRRRVRRR
jgi:hypothetical protein